jgi:SAM-dependent methyltransferase
MNSPEASHEYKDDFFDYINSGSTASARVISPLLVQWLSPASLLDVGCGAGAWCKQWTESGVSAVFGVDGEYVNRSALLIPEGQFKSRDLSQSFDLNQQFDLVTSLEVAEHVAESSAKLFVENLARHGDAVMFSAAVPGQGGEFHVNEQPLDYWRAHFEALGFRCFDPVRPRVVGNVLVEPWYRYNTLLYVRGAKVNSLPREVLDTEVPSGSTIREMAPLSWRTRNAILRNLPEFVVAALVHVKHAWTRKTRSGAAS